jgi:hypothetical protein
MVSPRSILARTRSHAAFSSGDAASGAAEALRWDSKADQDDHEFGINEIELTNGGESNGLVCAFLGY